MVIFCEINKRLNLARTLFEVNVCIGAMLIVIASSDVYATSAGSWQVADIGKRTSTVNNASSAFKCFYKLGTRSVIVNEIYSPAVKLE